MVGDDTQRRIEQLVATCLDLYDFAPVGYLIVGDDDRMADANQVAAELLGRQREDLRGRPVGELVGRHDRLRFREFWRQSIAGVDDVSCEVDLRHASGEFLTVACHVRRSQQLGAWIVGLIDVTALHEARRVAEDRLDLESRAEIAQHLYDSIRQRLFGITIMVEAVSQLPRISAKVRHSLDRVHRELGDIITDIREIIFDEVEAVTEHRQRRHARPSEVDPPEADPAPRSD